MKLEQRSPFNYDWELKKTTFPRNKGRVFSCFSCAGGSTMGYELAGFDVIGCCEIDKTAYDIYVANHSPKFGFNCSIKELLYSELPDELFHLDILDGSPPCTTFSMAGLRDKVWGVEKTFREGQTKQVLDTLFFDFIALANRLRPKVVIAENVKGLLLGKAQSYVKRIYEEFDKAGYSVSHYLLNASYMGVPQRRERIFFVCVRKDLGFLDNIDMSFNYRPITFGELSTRVGAYINGKTQYLWENRISTDRNLSYPHKRIFKKNGFFGQALVHNNEVCPTLTSHRDCAFRYDKPRFLSLDDWRKISTFPRDFNFYDRSPYYFMGMSVPPVMMANIAMRVYENILSKINTCDNSAFRELLLSL